MEHLIQVCQRFQISGLDIFLILLAAFFMSFSKSGMKGIGIISIPLLALVFGAKESTGILLPILMFLDVIAVYVYTRHADWKVLFKMLPWAVVGVIIGVWFGDGLDEDQFRKYMSWIVLACVIGLFWWDRRKSKSVPTSWWFAAMLGLGIGFTTMIGNLAGPLMTIYLFAMRLDKNAFIGTTAWFFFIINIIKLPFHIFVWNTVNSDSIVINISLIPFLVFFFFIGYQVVKRIPNQNYKNFILVLTALGAIFLFLK